MLHTHKIKWYVDLYILVTRQIKLHHKRVKKVYLVQKLAPNEISTAPNMIGINLFMHSYRVL